MKKNDEARILAQSAVEGAGKRATRIAAGAAVLVFGVVAAFGTVQDAPEPVTPHPVVETLAPPIRVEEGRGQGFWHEERFQRGDTFAAILDRLGVQDADADRLLKSQLGSLRLLRPGTTVQAITNEAGELASLWFINGRDRLVTLDRAGDEFKSAEQPADLRLQVVMKSGEIRSSLFAATDAAGLSDQIAVQLADIFSGDIDFHRDLRRGDRFVVVFEMLTHFGRAVKSGRVLAAEFVNEKKTYRAVWFAGTDGKGGYYTPEGKNLRKAFLRSPLEFSRITSGFGMRLHPLFRKWRAHTGVDYGAPAGTRVKATADAVVEFVGRQGGYGNVVVLRHHGGYSTLYAHLSRFAAGIRRGMRVAQGEAIGFVGMTGWATGPHLHYEFRANNRTRNPLTIAFAAAQPISADRMAAFRAVTAPLAADLDLLRGTNLALLE